MMLPAWRDRQWRTFPTGMRVPIVGAYEAAGILNQTLMSRLTTPHAHPQQLSPIHKHDANGDTRKCHDE